MNIDLSNIPSKYRPAPFWSWNDKLEPEELRRQIREMHRVGLGGFFMHARSGLRTEYLSPEWLHCVEVCLDEAGKCGMNAWLYDENGWPSGFGGGLVNGMGLDYQQKYLRSKVLDAKDAALQDHVIAFYSPDGGTLLGRELPAGTTGNILCLYFDVNCYYVDNMDGKVVAEFLRVTHQYYEEHIAPHLLKNLAGIFTDEPQLSRNGIPWSFVLEDEFAQEYGQALLPELPKLFLNLDGFETLRIHFWRLCGKLFAANFMKQISDWCKAHNWQLTGHHVLEGSLAWQISSNGAIMPQYQYYTMPGMDYLGRLPCEELTQHQLVSVAAQYGQKQILTESLALTGWACHFSGMRWVCLPQLARGVNFLCPHLEGYSLRGRRKRDYPASAFYHQPWWDDYKVFNDGISRIGMILAESKALTDVLVIHPLSSAWKHYTGKDNAAVIKGFDDALMRLVHALDARFIEHHYADEIIAEDVGSVEGKEFRLGQCRYRYVILPQLSNLSGVMAKLLRRFGENGGWIIKVRDQNETGSLTVDGKTPDAEFQAWFDALPGVDSEEAAADCVMAALPERIQVTENGVPTRNILGIMRESTLNGRTGRFYYFANMTYHQGAHLVITLPRSGSEVDLLNPVTGELTVLDGVSESADVFSFRYPMAAAGDAAFFVADKSDLPHTPIADYAAGQIACQPDAQFVLKSATDNILTLDRARYRVDGVEEDTFDVIDIQTRLLARKACCDLELDFDFTCGDDFDFTAPLKLAVENPEKYTFKLNGKPFAAKAQGYLFDKAFELVTLPAECRPGVNTLTLKLRFTQPESVYTAIEAAKRFESEYNKLCFETELESVYLCGDFTVRASGAVQHLPRRASRFSGNFTLGRPMKGQLLDSTDLLSGGLPFFSGKLTLEKTFELTEAQVQKIESLTLNLYGANSCCVKLNGIDCGGCYYEPFAWNVKHALKTGTNTLELELATSLRNMLGPHHLEEGESYAVDTLSFNREPNVIGWKPQPYNMGYCFVDLGVRELVFRTK